MHIKFGSDNLKARDHFQILSVDERIIVKQILREIANDDVNGPSTYIGQLRLDVEL
jgi:hypothetical protein